VLDLAPDAPSLAGLDVERVRGSVLDKEVVERAVAGAQVVYHLAAKVHLNADRDGSLHALNVGGTQNMLAAVEKTGARLVHCSSHSALERVDLARALSEDNPLALSSRTAYRRSKARAEEAVIAAVSERKLHAVIVNPSVMIGPWDFEPSLVARALLALARRELPAVIEAVTDYVDARDVAQAMLVAAERGVPGERYLLTGEVLTMAELLALWSDVAKAQPPGLNFPLWMGWWFLPGAMLWALLSGKPAELTRGVLEASDGNKVSGHQKATAVLGYAPRTIRESLADTHRFFVEQGWLSAG
jgi:dihydroflavonol-4-reductase